MAGMLPAVATTPDGDGSHLPAPILWARAPNAAATGDSSSSVARNVLAARGVGSSGGVLGGVAAQPGLGGTVGVASAGDRHSASLVNAVVGSPPTVPPPGALASAAPRGFAAGAPAGDAVLPVAVLPPRAARLPSPIHSRGAARARASRASGASGTPGAAGRREGFPPDGYARAEGAPTDGPAALVARLSRRGTANHTDAMAAAADLALGGTAGAQDGPGSLARGLLSAAGGSLARSLSAADVGARSRAPYAPAGYRFVPVEERVTALTHSASQEPRAPALSLFSSMVEQTQGLSGHVAAGRRSESQRLQRRASSRRKLAAVTPDGSVRPFAATQPGSYHHNPRIAARAPSMPGAARKPSTKAPKRAAAPERLGTGGNLPSGPATADAAPGRVPSHRKLHFSKVPYLPHAVDEVVVDDGSTEGIATLFMDEWLKDYEEEARCFSSDVIYKELRISEVLSATQELAVPNRLRTAVVCSAMLDAVERFRQDPSTAQSAMTLISEVAGEMVASIYSDEGGPLPSGSVRSFLDAVPHFTRNHALQADVDRLGKFELLHMQQQKSFARLKERQQMFFSQSSKRSDGELIRLNFQAWAAQIKGKSRQRKLLGRVFSRLCGVSKRDVFGAWRHVYLSGMADQRDRVQVALNNTRNRLEQALQREVELRRELEEKEAELIAVKAEAASLRLGLRKKEASEHSEVVDELKRATKSMASALLSVGDDAVKRLYATEKRMSTFPNAEFLVSSLGGTTNAPLGAVGEDSDDSDDSSSEDASTMVERAIRAPSPSHSPSAPAATGAAETVRRPSEIMRGLRRVASRKLQNLEQLGISSAAMTRHLADALDPTYAAELSDLAGLVARHREDAARQLQELKELREQPDRFLLLWVNYHLSRAIIDGVPWTEKVENFGSDWRDGRALAALLCRLVPHKVPAALVNELDPQRRISALLKVCEGLEPPCATFASADSITEGRSPIIASLVARLFSTFSGLTAAWQLDTERGMIAAMEGVWRKARTMLALMADAKSSAELIPDRVTAMIEKVVSFEKAIKSVAAAVNHIDDIMQDGQRVWPDLQNAVVGFAWRTFEYQLTGRPSTLVDDKKRRIIDAFSNLRVEHLGPVLKTRAKEAVDADIDEYNEHLTEQLRRMLRRFLDDLRRIFLYYAADEGVGGAAVISHSNWWRLLKDCNMRSQVSQKNEALDDIYQKCKSLPFTAGGDTAAAAPGAAAAAASPHAGDRRKRGPPPLDGADRVSAGGAAEGLTVRQFVHALVYLSLEQHLSAHTLEEGLETLLERNVLPYAGRSEKESFQVLMESVQVRAVFTRHRVRLKRVFQHYAAVDKRSISTYETLNLTEFMALIQDAKLMQGSSLTEHAARKIFRSVQVVKIDAAVKNDEDGGGSSELVYSEFLEALAAVGVFKQCDPFTPFDQRLDTFLKDHILRLVGGAGAGGGVPLALRSPTSVASGTPKSLKSPAAGRRSPTRAGQALSRGGSGRYQEVGGGSSAGGGGEAPRSALLNRLSPARRRAASDDTAARLSRAQQSKRRVMFSGRAAGGLV